jgi:sugar phosphate isomerase/epimerase
MTHPNRRHFLAASLALPALAARATAAGATLAGDRKFTMDLTPGAIGVGGPLPKVIELAHKNGFESVAPDAGFLAKLSDAENDALLADLKAKGLVWGAAGLPVDFRGSEDAYQKGLEALPAQAKALQRAKVTRVGTWIRPGHESLTYQANFVQHSNRLRAIATILDDHGLRFGLEYVGPKTSWTAARHPFVHTLAEQLELIAAIHRKNVGVVLDSWHWYTAGESVDDLKALKNEQVVACDLNDAPKGIPVDQQMDLKRDLPLATGVIDLKAFLGALVAIGYDGPVRAEPFKAELRSLPPEEAVAVTAKAMKAAFALVDGA